jgi:hypothetical protein
VATGLEARETASFRLELVDGKDLVVTSGRMHHVVRAAADRPPIPTVDEVEDQRCVDTDRRV